MFIVMVSREGIMIRKKNGGHHWEEANRAKFITTSFSHNNALLLYNTNLLPTYGTKLKKKWRINILITQTFPFTLTVMTRLLPTGAST